MPEIDKWTSSPTNQMSLRYLQTVIFKIPKHKNSREILAFFKNPPKKKRYCNPPNKKKKIHQKIGSFSWSNDPNQQTPGAPPAMPPAAATSQTWSTSRHPWEVKACSGGVSAVLSAEIQRVSFAKRYGTFYDKYMIGIWLLYDW